LALTVEHLKQESRDIARADSTDTEFDKSELRIFYLVRLVMKHVINAYMALILLTACVTPFSDRKAAQEPESLSDYKVSQTEPLRDDELVAEFNQFALNARLIPRGILVNLEDLSFEFGKAKLTHKARIKLRDIARVLSNHRVVDRLISVEGHTDAVGRKAYNLMLSKERAKAVARELIFNQIQSERITVLGHGEQYPIVPNTSPDGSDDPKARAKNRRVEVIIGSLGHEAPINGLQ